MVRKASRRITPDPADFGDRTIGESPSSQEESDNATMRHPGTGIREGLVDEPATATIRAAMDGDEASFVALVQPLELPVWRFLVRMLGDPGLAEDVAQDTFVKVFLRLETFRGKSKFSTWVFQIARNTAIDAIRKRDRQVKVVDQIEFADPAEPATGTWRIELEEALATLSPLLRETLVLIDISGLTYQEASEVLETPIGTVKSRLHAGRAELAGWMRANQ